MPTPVLFPVSLWNTPESSSRLEKQRGTLTLCLGIGCWRKIKHKSGLCRAWSCMGFQRLSLARRRAELAQCPMEWIPQWLPSQLQVSSPAKPPFYPKLPRHMLQAFLTAGSLAAVWTVRAPAALSSFSILSTSSFLPYFVLGLGICLRGRSQARACWFK